MSKFQINLPKTAFSMKANLSVEFLRFIRKEKKFKNIEQLRKQINSDLLIAKNTK